MPRPIQEIPQLIARSRPIRYGANTPNLKPPSSLERITVKATRDVGMRHYDWTKEIWGILQQATGGQLPSLDTVRSEQSKSFTDDLPQPSKNKCCSDFKELKTKIFDPIDQANIDTDFSQAMGDSVNSAFNRAGESFASDLVGTNSAIYSSFLISAIAEILRISEFKARAAWRRIAPIPGSPLTGAEDFITELERNGFQLVRDKVTRYFTPLAKQEIVTGLRSGLTWAQIASRLNKKIGTGALWQWQRLVRNEMGMAISTVVDEQYRSLGVDEVKFSRSMTARPASEICAVYADTDQYGLGKGVFPIELAPKPIISTHIGCQCTWTPRYNRTFEA